MPKMANGIYLDADLARAPRFGDGGRATLRPETYCTGCARHFVRVLGYVNHANMGNYQEAIDEFLAHETASAGHVLRLGSRAA